MVGFVSMTATKMASFFNSLIRLVAGIAVVLSTTPVVGLLMLPLGMAYHRLQHRYRSSAREVQRLQSVSRSPILQQVSH
jgi:hypothetical protein